MSPAVAPQGKIPALDFEKALLEASAPPDKATRQEVQTALKESSDACGSLKQKALYDPAGTLANYRLNFVAFVGYLITPDSHHRGQVTKLARQVGHPADTKPADGLWEWASRWRNCGFGRRSGGSSSR